MTTATISKPASQPKAQPADTFALVRTYRCGHSRGYVYMLGGRRCATLARSLDSLKARLGVPEDKMQTPEEIEKIEIPTEIADKPGLRWHRDLVRTKALAIELRSKGNGRVRNAWLARLSPGKTPGEMEYNFITPHHSDLDRKQRGFKRWHLADLEPGVYALGSEGQRAYTRVVQGVALPTFDPKDAIRLVNAERAAGPYSDRMGELADLLTDFGDWASGRIGAILADAKAGDAVQWERASAVVVATSPIYGAEWLKELHPKAAASLNEDAALGLAPLDGSPKQVSWARSIRARQIRRAKGWAQLARTVFAGRQAAGKLRDRHRDNLGGAVLGGMAVLAACKDPGRATARAKWWIDMRRFFNNLDPHRARDHEGEETAGQEDDLDGTVTTAIVTGRAHHPRPTPEQLVKAGLISQGELDDLLTEFGS